MGIVRIRNLPGKLFFAGKREFLPVPDRRITGDSRAAP